MYFSNMKSSASFDKTGVSEIGLKCLLLPVTGFSLGTDATTCFHAQGSIYSLWGLISGGLTEQD